jgi:hypothetical protein
VAQVHVILQVGRKHNQHHADKHDKDIANLVSNALAEEEPAGEDGEQDSRALGCDGVRDEEELEGPEVEEDGEELAAGEAEDERELLDEEPARVGEGEGAP